MNKKPKFNAKGNTFTPKATKKAPMNKPRGTPGGKPYTQAQMGSIAAQGTFTIPD